MSERQGQLTEEQRMGIERTDLSMALTSGAGCGKTFVLARRYEKVLLDDGRPDAPSRVVAVTFTEKAALEMRQRVGTLLAERLAETDDPDRRRLLRQWINRLAEARISTIHGFCASVLRAWALTAGVDPAFGVLADEFARTRMLEDAATAAARQAFETDDERVLELLDAFDPDRVVEMVQTLLSERPRWSARDYSDSAATLERWEQNRQQMRMAAWEALDVDSIAEDADRLATVPCDDPSDKLWVYRQRLLTTVWDVCERRSASDDDWDVLSAKPGGIGSAKRWGSETIKEVRSDLKALAGRLLEMQVYEQPIGDADERAARCLAVLTEVAADADARYALAKRRAGLLDFEDLLLRTRDLLRDHREIRRAVAGDIRHMLIDEFQDTDALQRELLYLAVDCDGWNPEPGRLFFVGDAMQSIYRFRGAEVEVFEQARAGMAAGARTRLGRNFRTHAAGLDLVNHVMVNLSVPSYDPLSAHRTDQPESPAAEVLLAEVEADAKMDEVVQAASVALADRIAAMLRDDERLVRDGAGGWRAVRPGDIAILLPRLTYTAPYEQALDDAGVPFYVVAGGGLYRQQEVYDLLNALAAIEDPLDDVALLGFLRGGMIGLDDNALLHLATAVGPPYRPRLRDPAVADRLDNWSRDALHRAADILDELSADKDALSIDALIERVLDRTAFATSLLAQTQGVRKVGNLRRIVDLARLAGQSQGTLGQFTRFLAELTFEEVRAEQAAVEAEDDQVVRIMTVHKAKGLEFPVVALADLNYQPKGRYGSLHVRGPWGLTLKTGSGEDEPVSSQLARLGEDAADEAEEIRRLYVAMTRHEDYLLMVAGRQLEKDGRLGSRKSMLRRLDTALDLAGVDGDDLKLIGGATLRVRAIQPSAPAGRSRRSTMDELADACEGPADLADRLAKPLGTEPRRKDAPLIAQPAFNGIERVAVTALAALERCPAAFRWNYDLRVPIRELTALRQSAEAPEERDEEAPMPDRNEEALGSDREEFAPAPARDSLDPATAGTLFHRCMELLDLTSPQPPEILVRQAAGEMGLEIDPATLAAEYGAMVDRLRERPLWKELCNARQRLAELPFAARFGRLVVDGVIDLLYQGTDGSWCIVDYKSDRVGREQVASHAEGYELQMLVYAAAARRFLVDEGLTREPTDPSAMLYFLRPGAEHAFDAARLVPDVADARLADLADRLAEYRRKNDWPRHRGTSCGHCRFDVLCGPDNEAPNVS